MRAEIKFYELLTDGSSYFKRPIFSVSNGFTYHFLKPICSIFKNADSNLNYISWNDSMVMNNEFQRAQEELAVA
jgi:hypothetical protein